MQHSEKYDDSTNMEKIGREERMDIIFNFSVQEYFDSREKMNFVRNGYYKLSRRLLLSAYDHMNIKKEQF